jgi:competence protein ComEC
MLNRVTFFTESLPGALIRNISINALETLILYLVIISFLLFLHYKKLVYWAIAGAFVCLLSVLNIAELHKQQKQQQLAFYSIANHHAFSLIDGKHNFLLADSALLQQRNTIDFHLSGYWQQSGIDHHHFFNFYNPDKSPVNIKHFAAYSFLVWHNKTIVFIHHPITDWQFLNKIQPDYVIIQNNAVKDLTGKETLLKNLIIDGNNKAYLSKKLKSQAGKAGIACHSIREDGAFIISR